MGPVLEFHSVELRWWGIWTCIFRSDGSFFSRILAWRSVDWVNRTRRIDPKTICVGFPRDCFPLWETNASESCEEQPIWDSIFTTSHCIFYRRFLFFCGTGRSFFRFFFGCSSTLWCGNEHLSPALHPVSVLWKWRSGGRQCSQGDRVQVPFK